MIVDATHFRLMVHDSLQLDRIRMLGHHWRDQYRQQIDRRGFLVNFIFGLKKPSRQYDSDAIINKFRMSILSRIVMSRLRVFYSHRKILRYEKVVKESLSYVRNQLKFSPHYIWIVSLVYKNISMSFQSATIQVLQLR